MRSVFEQVPAGYHFDAVNQIGDSAYFRFRNGCEFLEIPARVMK